MNIRLSILGQQVWSLHLCLGCRCGNDASEEGPTVIGAGSSGDFERDTAPLDPADHYGEWEDRSPRRFGFGGLS